jgi:serine/threonine-protein kinase
MHLPAGMKVGRYEIRSRVGAGGMGEVYLAHDTQLDRPAALKLLPAKFVAEPESLRRFKQEARAISSLNHPNILTIFEVGEVESTHFIATEFVEGMTLRARLAQSRLTPVEALDVLAQLAGAISAAHRAGVVHRDLKPENVMIRPDGIVKILDFGLAKLSEARTATSDPHAPKATDPGTVMGTAGYMSPEQARGMDIDSRTDIFNLGVLLYEMLTARAPFEGWSTGAMIVAILERDPPPMNSMVPELPPELQRIVDIALAKKPADRYQTAQDLLAVVKALKQDYEYRSRNTGGSLAPAELHNAVTQVGMSTHDTGELTNAHTGQSRPDARTVHKAARTSSGAIDSLAVMPLLNGSSDPGAEYLSDGITESIINSLSQLPGLRVMARSTVFHYKGQQIDPRQVGQELDVRAMMTGRVIPLGNKLIINVELVDVADGRQLWGEQYNRSADDILAVQEEISREILGKLKLRLTGGVTQHLGKRFTEDTEAYRLYLQGRFYSNKNTREGLMKGIEFFQKAIELDPEYALAYSGLADAWYGLSSAHLPPNEAMPKARDAATRALELDESLAEAHASIGLVRAFYEWDWRGAEDQYKRAIALNPGHASSHHRYGWYLALMGRLDEATELMKRAEELDPLSLEINTDLGLSLFFARDYDAAFGQFEKAVQMDPNFIWTRFFVAWALEQKGDVERAIDEYQKALAIENALFIRTALGHAYALAGQPEKTRAILTELLSLKETQHVSPYDLAILHSVLGEKDQAFAELERAFELRAEALVWLKVDPRLDPLRLDRRFIDLLRRVGLPL